jgi:hypothetical protein
MIHRIFLLAFLILSSCSKEEKSTYLAPPTYQTLHTKTTHGAYFQIKNGNDFYLACSIHQGAAANGAHVFREGQDAPVILGKRAHVQRDLHLWTYDASTLPDADALNYRSDVKIEIGDRIYILNQGQKIAATVVALPQDEQFRYGYKTDEPFPAGGMSGSPIFLPRTGSAIGVLQTANDKKAATIGGFEKITLP